MVNLLLGTLLMTGGLNSIQSCGGNYIEVHSKVKKTKEGIVCDKSTRRLINTSNISSILPNRGKSIKIYEGDSRLYYICGTSYEDLLNTQNEENKKIIKNSVEEIQPKDSSNPYKDVAIPFNLYK